MTQTTVLDPRRLPAPRGGVLDRLVHELARRTLARCGVASVARDPDVWEIPDPARPQAPIRVEVYDASFYRHLALEGSLGAARSWIEGGWDCRPQDLTRLLRAALVSPALRDGLDGTFASVASLARRLGAVLRRNSLRGSRDNVRAHYDLGNALFERMLDPSLTYSSAIFDTPDATLEQAQRSKIDRICRRLGLRPEHRLLEIGTGWGSFALRAAGHYGCHVTTTTLSQEQHALASARIRAAGLGARVELLRSDYRELRSEYDRLVSIEMIEAVGDRYLPTYFRTCSERLRPDGAMSLQAIVIGDQHHRAATRHVDFIKTYIFPGGCLPSIARMAECTRDQTDLRIHHLEDITPHYAETLRRWRARLDENAPALRARGYDEGFLRMWQYYLSYCEAGFEERHIGCVQLDLVKPGWRPTAL